jgi:hypothetical protein
MIHELGKGVVDACAGVEGGALGGHVHRNEDDIVVSSEGIGRDAQPDGREGAVGTGGQGAHILSKVVTHKNRHPARMPALVTLLAGAIVMCEAGVGQGLCTGLVKPSLSQCDDVRGGQKGVQFISGVIGKAVCIPVSYAQVASHLGRASGASRW